MTKKKADRLKKDEKPKHPGGRPSTYTKEIGEKICRALSTSTKSITLILAENEEFPTREIVWGWRLDHDEFAHMYNKARLTQADLLAEEVNEIADNNIRDTIYKTNKDGEEYEVCNTEWVNRSRLRVDTRKWYASKMLPKVYGAAVELENEKEKNRELQEELRQLRAKLDEQNKREF